ncbi:hypothetical protein ARMSODRAFT_1022491 [Armillaria solidipes]|uniref:NAD(P)-binding protein n=1 Tax=Armillaria solidipes TaxID=1076256 RepID=A0A2H3BKH4_9AGAR|nr:hypothetical protein ARMSODRAFT_1022491 [Armillaria solidipes]
MSAVDLADFSSVVTFTDRAERELERLDILVDNAGVTTWEYEQVASWERTLHVKSLAPALLAIRMIPKVLETARKHSETGVSSTVAIIVNSINPEFYPSGLRTSIPTDEAEAMRKEEEELCFATEERSRKLVYGAIGSLDDEKLRGKYIQMSEVVEESDFMISEDGKIVQDNVWDLNMRNILLLDSVLFGTIFASPAYCDESC